MDQRRAGRPVVVGVDGSESALQGPDDPGRARRRRSTSPMASLPDSRRPVTRRRPACG